MTTPQRSIRLDHTPHANLVNRTYTKGEVFYDDGLGTLVLFDGQTPGGIPLLRADMANQAVSASGIRVSDTHPTAATNGTLWFNSSNGGLYVYYGGQWIQSSNNATGNAIQGQQQSFVTTDVLTAALQDYATTSALTSAITTLSSIGDLIVTNATITSAFTNESINLVSNGTGAVNVTGNFNVKLASGPKLIEGLANGTINFYVPNVNSLDSAIDIIGSPNGTRVIPQNTGVMLHLTGQPNIPSRVYNDGANNYAGYFGRRYNGTTDAPTAVASGNIITRIGGTPYNTNGWPALTTVRMDMVALDNQTTTAQGSEIQFWTTPAGATTIAKNLTINTNGITFSDATTQNTAGIPLTQKGVANGVATLGSDGKVSTAQLPAGSVVFKGTWDASVNSPTLANGFGTSGWEYSVTTAGSVNFGAGAITFSIGDWVIYNGTIWQRIPGGSGGSGGVTSFNSRTGAITLSTADVTTALTTGSVTNTMLVNNSVFINPGVGIAGGGPVQLGGSVTVSNSGVTSTAAGTGITVSGSTGDITISSNVLTYVRNSPWTHTPGFSAPFNLFDVNPTVQGSTRYHYKITIAGTGVGGTNGHVAFGWGTAGTASVAQYTCLARIAAGSSQISISTFTTTYSVTSGSVAPDLAVWIVNQAVQNVSYELSGYIDITTGGSIIPQMLYTSGGGTTTWQTGSNFILTPVGPIGVNTVNGTWA